MTARLAMARPEERAAAFEVMTTDDGDALVRLYPEIMSVLDGAPPELRYAANRALIRAEMTRLEEYADRLEETTGIGITPTALRPLIERIDEYQRWLDEDRQILLFDPSGDGRVVEVFGNLSDAARVAVVVPGMANDIYNFSNGDGGFRTNARDLYDATSGLGIATVAWLGYDSPDNIGATLRSAANPGEERTITVVAHSYGTVLAGTAARTGLEADNLVFVGSPGTTLDAADEAELRDSGRVWVALADKDPIALGISLSELPPFWVPPAFWVPWLGTDMWNEGAEALWHGTNPADEEFGAIRFTTDGCSGHSSYFDAGSLDNLAKIVAGLYTDVDIISKPGSGGSSW
jgi:pimeloyl-ACP methyl ester carboxylesterase